MKQLFGALLVAAALAAPVEAMDTQGDPTKYVGDWAGDMSMNAGGEPTQVDLTLAYDNGAISGSITYPALGCSGELLAPDNQLRTTPTGQVVSAGGEGVLTIAHLDGGSGNSTLCSTAARFTLNYYDAAYFGVETLVVNQAGCSDADCASPGAGTAASAQGSVHRAPP